MIRTLCVKTCVICGEEFETYSHSALYCQKKECQLYKKNVSYLPTMPAKDEDMKVGVIVTIMQDENITYENYAKNRKFFIERYIEKYGIPK